jgi:hypothetical protein
MLFPPLPTISRGRIVASAEVRGEDCWTPWPAPMPYQNVTQGCVLVHQAPVASLPKWIIKRITMPPRQRRRPVLRLPQRGIDEIPDGLIAYVKYSRRGTRALM